MTLDIVALRADTPGVNNRIHLNNAGASLMPRPVMEALVEHLNLESNIGGYEAFHEKEAEIERLYHSCSRILNCHSTEIAFIENATRAWDMAFYSIPFQPGDRVLTSIAEYASNYIAYLQMKKKSGIEIDVVPNDEFGQIDIAKLSAMIDERVRLISITHVPTNCGLVNPAESVGKIAREAGILYMLDACQSVGQMVIDVEKIGCDILSCTGRKYLRGPRGTGILYIRQERLRELEPVFLDLHAATWTAENSYAIRDDARRFENWEQFYAGKLGLTAAVDYALAIGLSIIEERVRLLADLLRKSLEEIAGVVVTDCGQTKCGIVSFYISGIASAEIVEVLAKKSINVSYSTVFGTRLDMQSRNLPEIVRASVHYYNTEDELMTLCEEIRELSKT